MVDYPRFEPQTTKAGEYPKIQKSQLSPGDLVGFVYSITEYPDNNLKCAYRYESLKSNDADILTSKIKVTVRYLGPQSITNIKDITNEMWWNNNNSYDIIRFFPACGMEGGVPINPIEDFGVSGYYWASEESPDSKDHSWYVRININSKVNFVASGTLKRFGLTLRPVSDH